jgi:hypothetical protein
MLTEQMAARVLALKYAPRKAVIAVVYVLGEVQDAPAGHKITLVGIVFDVADNPLGSLFTEESAEGADKVWGGEVGKGRVVEVVGGGAEGVDFKFLEEMLWEISEEPVNCEGAFDSALRVQDQDNFVVGGVLEGFFNETVSLAAVSGAVAEVSLDDALDDIEDYACSIFRHSRQHGI